jgi:hypothetical protein
MKLQMGEREVTATLTTKVDKEGKLTAQWKSERGEPELAEVQYSQGKLAFKMKSTNPERQWEANFAGTVERDTLSGTLKSERGEIAIAGTRKGAPLIGTWMLDVASERGPRKQRLRVNPDMSALYGAVPIKKINVEDGRVDFLAVLELGDRTYELRFDGKLEDAKLTGELTSSRGTRKVKVTGTKVVRTFRRRSTE